MTQHAAAAGFNAGVPACHMHVDGSKILSIRSRAVHHGSECPRAAAMTQAEQLLTMVDKSQAHVLSGQPSRSAF